MDKEKRINRLKAIIGLVFLVIALFFALITFITDFIWFKELGYVSVFFTKLFTQLKIGIPVFLVILMLSVFYLKRLKAGYNKKVASNDHPNKKILNLTEWGYSTAFAAVITGLTVTKLWYRILELTNSTDFGIKDPLFKQDISFYIFKLDFFVQLNDMALFIITAFAGLTVLYYLTLLTMRKPQMFETQEEAQYGTDVDSEAYDEEERFTGNVSSFNDAFKKFNKKVNFGHRKPKKQFDDDNFKRLLSSAIMFCLSLGV